MSRHLLAVLAGLLLLARVGPGQADAGAQELLAVVNIEVAADGSVTSVAPDPALPEGLRAGLQKRIARWRYEPAQWEGRPVSLRFTSALRLQPVTTTSGGYAIRVLGVSTQAPPGVHMEPPVFPRSAMRAAVNAVLVYRVHVAEDGRVSLVGREYPRAVGGHLKSLDEVSKEAIAGFSRPPYVVDGKPVACDLLQVFTFYSTGKPNAPEPEAPFENQCPAVKLETKIEGTML